MNDRIDEFLDHCRIRPDKPFRLADHDPDWAGNPKTPKRERKKQAEEHLAEELAALAQTQELLYAADSWSVLLIFQAMDAAGKDSTIKHVMSGVNPQGCQVFSFKHPSAEELDHNFLWRCMRATPERGRIGIFNRSYYEEVLIVKVHPEFVAAQRVPNGHSKKDFWGDRYDDINNFERHLHRNGTKVLKFFLNVSREEQRRRFLERIEDPTKHWKFSAGDVAQRQHWDEYMQAYEQAIEATSTPWAPWYVVPADHKWVTRMLVAKIVVREIQSLGLQYPQVTPAQAEAIEACRRKLTEEQ